MPVFKVCAKNIFCIMDLLSAVRERGRSNLAIAIRTWAISSQFLLLEEWVTRPRTSMNFEISMPCPSAMRMVGFLRRRHTAEPS